MAKASAHITLTYVIDIVATYRYYLLQSSTMVKPSVPTTNPPSSSWDDSEPTYTSGSTNSLYYVDLTVFSDDTFSYSPVSLSTAYEAAKEAYNKADNAQTRISEAETKIEKTDEAITLCALKSETVPVPVITDNGSQAVKVTNALRDSISGLKLYGKTTQFTTTGKNLLANTAVSTSTNGVTFTVNADGSITTSGTATAEIYYAVTLTTILDAGTYFLSGMQSNKDGARIYVWPGYYSDYGDGCSFSYQESCTCEAYIHIGSGVNCDGLTFYPQIERGSTATAYEPYTGGIASPNPDYPQDLESIGESNSQQGNIEVRVSSASKNLLANTAVSTSTNGVTFTVNADGSITTSGTATDTIYFPLSYNTMLSIGNYFISGVPNGASACIYIAPLYYGDYGYGCGFSIEKSGMFEVYILIGSGVNCDNLTFYPQIEQGSTATAYEPYKVPYNLSIYIPDGLPGIPVSSGGNYTDSAGQQWICDEVDLGRGVYVQRVGRQVLDGSETWFTYGSSTGTEGLSFFCQPSNLKPGYNLSLCSAYRNLTGAWDANHIGMYGIYSDHSTAINKYFRPPNDSVTTVAQWKAWLAENPMELIYALAEPVEITLSDEQIAAFHALANDPGYIVVQSEAEMILELGDISTGKSIKALTNTMNTQLKVLGDRVEMNFDTTTKQYNDVNGKLEVEIVNRKKHITYAGDTAITIGGNSGILMSLDNDNGIIFSKIVSVTGSNPDDLDSTITTMYQLHDNNTTAPTGTWSASLPDMSSDDVAEKFLWIRRTTTYTDGTTSTIDSVAFGTWDGDNFHTGSIFIKLNERAQFGNFAYIPRSDGSLSFLKVGG